MDLDKLDAFLAEKVMGWTWHEAHTAISVDGETLPLPAWLPPEGYVRGGEWRDRWSPTRSPEDAEQVRARFLVQSGKRVSIRCIPNDAGDMRGLSVRDDALFMRRNELLAIARACGWKE